MSESVKLIECFRTFQGEGPDSGRAMLLLRFKYCDKQCFFCDTTVKMRISEEGTYTLKDIQEQLNAYRCGLMITGGEPTFRPHYKETQTLLTQLNYKVANVETNGSQLLDLLNLHPWPTKYPNVKFIYSPKILNAKDEYDSIQLTHTILDHPSVYIKIPYLGNGHCDNYCKWVNAEITSREQLNIVEPNSFDYKVWLMAVGDNEKNQKKNSADVMDACEKYKFNFSGRTHIMYDFI